MDAVKYLNDKRRMCAFENCLTCPITVKVTSGKYVSNVVSCASFIASYPEETVAIVEKWAKEHPERTRQSVFLERYPNAPVEADGVLEVHPCEIDKTVDYDACQISCAECRKRYWLAPVEEEKK